MPYLIVAVVVVIFIAVVFIVAGKDSKERIDMVSKLTEEQRNILMSTEVNFVEKNAWVQKAMVAKMKDKGNKIDIRLLWFNEVLQNNEYNKITIADVAITQRKGRRFCKILFCTGKKYRQDKNNMGVGFNLYESECSALLEYRI